MGQLGAEFVNQFLQVREVFYGKNWYMVKTLVPVGYFTIAKYKQEHLYMAL